MEKKEKVITAGDNVYLTQAGMRVYVKTADICAMTGKSNQWIGQLTSQGILNKTKTPCGVMYELAPTVGDYCAMLENRARLNDEKDIELERKRRAAEYDLKKTKSEIARLELSELQGSMHRSEDVRAMTEDLVYTMRSALLSLPGRLARDMADADSAAEAERLIRREVYKIMEELAGYEYDPRKYEERVRERTARL